MAGFGSKNTSKTDIPNAVDASQWPASFDAPLTAPATPGAYWSCDLLYPSRTCSDKPTLSLPQVTSLISNLGGLTQCLADYVAKAGNASVVIPSCDEAGSWTATGKFMCDALTAIDAKIAALGGGDMFKSVYDTNNDGIVDNASWADPTITNSEGPGGFSTPVSFINIVKSELDLFNQFGIVTGASASAAEQTKNKNRIYSALQAAAATGRPLVFPRNAIVSINGANGFLDLQSGGVEINLNGGTLRHGGTENATMFYVHGSSATKLNGFKLYNGTIDMNAQGGKTAGYYGLSMDNCNDVFMQDITFLDPFTTAFNHTDYGSAPFVVRPASSDTMRLQNVKTKRSAANLAYTATHTLMLRGDQFVITHCNNVKIDGYYGEHSGTSGISIGIGSGLTIIDATFKEVAAPLYCESMNGAFFSRITQFGHRHWWSDPLIDFRSACIWVTDADQSTASAGHPGSMNVLIDNVIMHDINRTGAVGDYLGVVVSGRDGNTTRNIRVSNVIGWNVNGGATGASLVTAEGLLENVTFSGVQSTGCSIAARANLSYITPGGTPGNRMTNCWFEGVNSENTGYGFHAPGSDPGHISSGIRNSHIGTSAIALVPSLEKVNVGER